MSITFDEVEVENIDAILAKRRDKGHYDEALVQFDNANIRAGRIHNRADEAGPFAGKKATSIKTSFKAALNRERNADYKEKIDVVVDGEDVYLVRKPGA